jgi:hypothetical protein
MTQLIYAALGVLMLNSAFASDRSPLEDDQAPLNPVVAREPITGDDLVVAQTLQAEEYGLSLDNEEVLDPGSSLVNMLPVMPEPVAQIYATYDARRASLGSAWDMDVHGFNRKIQFATLIPTLINHDTFSKQDLPFARIKSEMLASLLLLETDAALQKDVKVGLATLERHLQHSPIEKRETNCNVQNLVSRLWSLAVEDQTLLYKILLILGDNHATGGGCYPGHAGRFADLYLITLRGFWQQ